MGPPRKKSRPNSEAPEPVLTSLDTDVEPEPTDGATGSSTTPSKTRTSWYGGSWRSKASPVAQVARESVSVAKGATSESSSDSQSLPRMPNNSKMPRKSIPSAAEATRVNANGSNTDANKSKEKVTEKQASKEEHTPPPAPAPIPPTDGSKDLPVEPPLPPDPCLLYTSPSPRD